VSRLTLVDSALWWAALLLLVFAPHKLAAQVSGADWRSDIAALDSSIRTIHPNPFRRVSEAAFAETLDDISSKAGRQSDQLTAVQLMHLIGALGDGHTTLEPSARLGFDRWFPVRFYRFADGLFVVAASAERSFLVRARVETIGGRPALTVADSVATLMGADNLLGRAEATHLLSSGPALHALGLIGHPDSLPLVVTTADGARQQVTLAARVSRYSLDWRFQGDVAGPPMPAGDTLRTAFERPAILTAFRRCDGTLALFLDCRRRYWFTLLPGQRTGYMQINFTLDDSAEPFEAFVARRFAEMDSVGVDRFVLDLRFNSGGDGSIVMPLVHALIKREEFYRQPGRFYVLVGRQTYSAAMSLIGHLSVHTVPIFVGEPGGAPLNNYGDPILVPLPHTGMGLNVSQRYWQYALSDDTTRTLPVAVPAVFRSVDYFAGRDPALAAILGDGPEARRVVGVLEREGAAAASALLEAQRARFGNLDWWVPWTLRDMRRLSERLLEVGRVADALMGFEANAWLYPGEWRVWEGLGSGRAAAGDVRGAREAYQRALTIAPNNWNSEEQRRALAALSAGG
jgi:hypothetical protein